MAPKNEPLWHVELAVMAAIVLQLILIQQLTVGPKYIIALLELLLLFGLRITVSSEHTLAGFLRRYTGLLLTALVTLANITSLILVARYLIEGHSVVTGRQLIISALGIYVTNIIIFGLWYWQIDGGGPEGRGTHKPPVDFLFPQMIAANSQATKQVGWQPSFFDYLYVSVTNATAFSPSDAAPITHRAKLLMTIQALTSLLTVALVAARAITTLA